MKTCLNCEYLKNGKTYFKPRMKKEINCFGCKIIHKKISVKGYQAELCPYYRYKERNNELQNLQKTRKRN